MLATHDLWFWFNFKTNLIILFLQQYGLNTNTIIILTEKKVSHYVKSTQFNSTLLF